MTGTELNPTAKDRTSSCSCTDSENFWLPVQRFDKKLKEQRKLVQTSCNQSFCSIYKVQLYILRHTCRLIKRYNTTTNSNYTKIHVFMWWHTSLGEEYSHLVGVYIPWGCARTMWSCLSSKKEKWNHLPVGSHDNKQVRQQQTTLTTNPQPSSHTWPPSPLAATIHNHHR